MEIAFVGQPFADEGNLREFVDEAVGDASVEKLSVMTAWAKYSGLIRVKDQLESFRARGGTSRLIVGIDEGGATEQGLRLALELFDSVHVLFDRSGRTFHPKIYLFEGPDVARLLVGSNNMTAGGVFYNYEGALQVLVDLAVGKEKQVVEQIVEYMGRLYGDTGVCKKLDADVLKELVADPRYRIRDERLRRRAPTGTPADDVDTRLDLDQVTPLFESSAEAKKSVPASGGSASVPSPVATPPIPSSGGVSSSTSAVTRRWYRRMSPSDAQHPPGADTAVTGNLKLNRAGHPIDQTTYFRNDFFGGFTWTSEATPRGPKETTIVPFSTVISGNDLGSFDLTIDHKETREAGQGNVTTWLHWGSLSPVMRATDYTDSYLVLERLADDSFHLEITPQEPVGFIQ